MAEDKQLKEDYEILKENYRAICEHFKTVENKYLEIKAENGRLWELAANLSVALRGVAR